MSDVRAELNAMRKTVKSAGQVLVRKTETIAGELRDRAKASLARGVANVKKAGERAGWRRV